MPVPTTASDDGGGGDVTVAAALTTTARRDRDGRVGEAEGAAAAARALRRRKLRWPLRGSYEMVPLSEKGEGGSDSSKTGTRREFSSGETEDRDDLGVGEQEDPGRKAAGSTRDGADDEDRQADGSARSFVAVAATAVTTTATPPVLSATATALTCR